MIGKSLPFGSEQIYNIWLSVQALPTPCHVKHVWFWSSNWHISQLDQYCGGRSLQVCWFAASIGRERMYKYAVAYWAMDFRSRFESSSSTYYSTTSNFRASPKAFPTRHGSLLWVTNRIPIQGTVGSQMLICALQVQYEGPNLSSIIGILISTWQWLLQVCPVSIFAFASTDPVNSKLSWLSTISSLFPPKFELSGKQGVPWHQWSSSSIDTSLSQDILWLNKFVSLPRWQCVSNMRTMCRIRRFCRLVRIVLFVFWFVSLSKASRVG